MEKTKRQMSNKLRGEEICGGIIQAVLDKGESEKVVQWFLSEASNCNNDLSDILIGCAAQSGGCETVITFDQKAAKIGLFELLE